MKLEPLKKDTRCHDEKGRRFRYDNRIIEAVEWLKEKLPFHQDLINKAFGDVIKK